MSRWSISARRHGGARHQHLQVDARQRRISLVRNDFKELGNIVGDERTGDLYVSDRGANRLYRLSTNNVLTAIAGNGTPNRRRGGLSRPANRPDRAALVAPFLPNGGFFTCEHDPGNRIWYIDPAGIIHRWMNGSDANNFRVGDGAVVLRQPRDGQSFARPLGYPGPRSAT